MVTLDPITGRASDIPLGERVDGRDKVTGAALFAADVRRPGMLVGKVLRSPLPHARILRIDTSAAQSMAGVRAVLTGADFPAGARFGRNTRDMPGLARDKVRFAGEKVAAVAADSAEIAERALSSIEVEYEALDAVYDPVEAMRPGAPLVHDPDEVRAWATGGQVVPDYPNGASAPAHGASVHEVQAALAAAARVFEHTFRTPIQHQAYIEPHTCLVEVDEHDVAHIWASNKAPLLLTRYLQEGLGLGRDRLAVHMLPVGGDFGGKGSFMDIPIAYLLARTSGRPVKMTMTYAEEMIAGNPRHASSIHVRSGVDATGRLVARWVTGVFNTGAYAAFKPAGDSTLPGFWRGAIGAYDVAVQRDECHMVYTNTVPAGHMRSPGETQAAFALECHTDLIARELGMSPVAFRLMNGARAPRLADDGRSPATSTPLAVQAVLDAAARAIDLDGPRPPDTGRGVALVEFSTLPERFSAILSARPDGRIHLQTPIIDNGAGQMTVFRQLLAEELHIPTDQVTVEQSIDNLEIDRGLSGSRTSRLVGKLLIELATRVRARLAELLGAEFGIAAAQVSAVPGGFRLPDGRFLALGEVAAMCAEPISEKLLFDPPPTERCAVFLAQAAEVHVDRQTGEVKPTRLVSVHERGRVLQPMLFQAQIDGAAAQGLGYALMESLEIEHGQVRNANLHEYKIPTAMDLPPLQTVLLPADASLGITPIGEGANVGVPPAIVNAVVDATGVPVFELPLRPEALAGIPQRGPG